MIEVEVMEKGQREAVKQKWVYFLFQILPYSIKCAVSCDILSTTKRYDIAPQRFSSISH